MVSQITKNIRDFVVRKLAALGIEVQRPAFLSELIANDEAGVANRIRSAALEADTGSTP